MGCGWSLQYEPCAEWCRSEMLYEMQVQSDLELSNENGRLQREDIVKAIEAARAEPLKSG